jgi:hypothetical protein
MFKGLGNPKFQQGMQNLLDPAFALPVAGALMSGRNNRESFGNAFSVGGLAAQNMKKRNMTVDYLKGVDPELAQAVEGGMDPTTAFQLFNTKHRLAQANKPTYGLTPQYATDDEGNLRPYVTSNTGDIKWLDLDGSTPADPVMEIDKGTHIELTDRRTGAVVRVIPKENYQEAHDTARGREEGKIAGEASANLSSTLAKSQYSVDLIDKLIADPNREKITGGSALNPWHYRPGSETRGTYKLAQQVENRTFLDAFSELKGAGHITDTEGQKAQDAFARLDRYQSDEDYLAALEELKAILTAGMARARGQAGQSDVGKPSEITVTPNTTPGGWVKRNAQ